MARAARHASSNSSMSEKKKIFAGTELMRSAWPDLHEF